MRLTLASPARRGRRGATRGGDNRLLDGGDRPTGLRRHRRDRCRFRSRTCPTMSAATTNRRRRDDARDPTLDARRRSAAALHLRADVGSSRPGRLLARSRDSDLARRRGRIAGRGSAPTPKRGAVPLARRALQRPHHRARREWARHVPEPVDRARARLRGERHRGHAVRRAAARCRPSSARAGRHRHRPGRHRGSRDRLLLEAPGRNLDSSSRCSTPTCSRTSTSAASS